MILSNPSKICFITMRFHPWLGKEEDQSAPQNRVPSFLLVPALTKPKGEISSLGYYSPNSGR